MSVGLGVGLIIGIGIILFLVGAVLAFFLTKKMFEKQLKENPPITEKMIRAMFLQMGRKPSEAQIKAVMRSMQQAKKEPNKK
ncbi:MAG: YneF family protein [Mycoplasmataceae bacterium]|nr:YneF family protein [Mycoplasmataceae bacterium]MBR2999143.1 YneF family protein [Mycoplasmataceae bacterium]MBR3348013.1 YneF family protein [Mycoplasmataceae bacterium]MBR4025415.1 YneF family protein [Mycoplasmataceae bacterium]